MGSTSSWSGYRAVFLLLVLLRSYQALAPVSQEQILQQKENVQKPSCVPKMLFLSTFSTEIKPKWAQK